jgi:hypothetical protein
LLVGAVENVSGGLVAISAILNLGGFENNDLLGVVVVGGNECVVVGGGGGCVTADAEN